MPAFGDNQCACFRDHLQLCGRIAQPEPPASRLVDVAKATVLPPIRTHARSERRVTAVERVPSPLGGADQSQAPAHDLAQLAQSGSVVAAGAAVTKRTAAWYTCPLMLSPTKKTVLFTK